MDASTEENKPKLPTVTTSERLLRVDDMDVELKNVRIPWEFVAFALNNSSSPGVVGKFFLNMLGVEGIKFDAKHEYGCRFFRDKFVDLTRILYKKRENSKRKRENAAAYQKIREQDDIQSPQDEIQSPQPMPRPSKGRSEAGPALDMMPPASYTSIGNVLKRTPESQSPRPKDTRRDRYAPPDAASRLDKYL
jgi:hypothetical protein